MSFHSCLIFAYCCLCIVQFTLHIQMFVLLVTSVLPCCVLLWQLICDPWFWLLFQWCRVLQQQSQSAFLPSLHPSCCPTLIPGSSSVTSLCLWLLILLLAMDKAVSSFLFLFLAVSSQTNPACSFVVMDCGARERRCPHQRSARTWSPDHFCSSTVTQL